MDLTSFDPWQVWTAIFAISSVRYLVMATLVFVPCYFIFRNNLSLRRIQEKFPNAPDYAREVGFSFLTFGIFALVGIGLRIDPIKQWSNIYTDFHAYPIWWYFASIVLAILIHDTYFYWTHRLMHHPRLFKTMHLVHHRSTNPTPWAAFAFHPTEAVVEAGVIYAIALTIPIHPSALLIFLVFMTAENVMGHLGYELFPNWLIKSRVGKWLNSSTNHNQHHKYFEGNYGLYFRFWDVWMGTTHKKYDARIEELTSQPYNAKQGSVVHSD